MPRAFVELGMFGVLLLEQQLVAEPAVVQHLAIGGLVEYAATQPPRAGSTSTRYRSDSSSVCHRGPARWPRRRFSRTDAPAGAKPDTGHGGDEAELAVLDDAGHGVVIGPHDLDRTGRFVDGDADQVARSQVDGLNTASEFAVALGRIDLTGQVVE